SCLPTSIAALTPPIFVLRFVATGAVTPPCNLIRARRRAAAPSTVRALLRAYGRGASCFLAASFGPGQIELPRQPSLLSAASQTDIQGQLQGRGPAIDRVRDLTECEAGVGKPSGHCMRDVIHFSIWTGSNRQSPLSLKA